MEHPARPTGIEVQGPNLVKDYKNMMLSRGVLKLTADNPQGVGVAGAGTVGRNQAARGHAACPGPTTPPAMVASSGGTAGGASPKRARTDGAASAVRSHGLHGSSARRAGARHKCGRSGGQ
jgi:hypothetical protein